MTSLKKTAAALLLAFSAPLAGAQDAAPAETAPATPAAPIEASAPPAAPAPATSAPAATPGTPAVPAPEPRTAFWGEEPGRPYEETDSYTLPVGPIRTSGYFWVDTGYMTRDNTQVGAYDQDVNYAQGRFVLGAAYRRDVAKVFAEARVQLVGFVNEYTKSQYEPHTQDAFVRIGQKSWDVQVGRFLGWEPYYRGNGIERFTAEEAGALGGVLMYRLDAAGGYEDEPGQLAVHWYPAPWAALEVGGVYGQLSSQNKVGVRPVLALHAAGALLMAGFEYVDWSPQDISNKAKSTLTGFGGRLQYTLLGATVGVNAARATVDYTGADGLVDTEKTIEKTTLGGFLEWSIWNAVLGGGYHLTEEDRENGENPRHHQAFASLLYELPVDGLSIKAVVSFARAQVEDVDSSSEWENDMKSIRVRLRYDFR